MSWHRYIWPSFLLLAFGEAAAEGYIVAVGAEVDTEDSRAFSAFGELATGDSTWISAGASISRTSAPGNSFDAIQADVQIDHLFDPMFEHLGVRAAVAYWGDSDVLDSIDLRGSVYLKYPRFSLSADVERRNYGLVIGPPVLRDSRTAEFSANGLGFAGRLQTGNSVSVYLGGMWYDYSRNANLQPRIDDLRFLSLSRLILANGLLDRKVHAGIELEFGLRTLDFSYANWRDAASQGGRIESFGVGLLTPLGASSDIEFSPVARRLRGLRRQHRAVGVPVLLRRLTASLCRSAVGARLTGECESANRKRVIVRGARRSYWRRSRVRWRRRSRVLWRCSGVMRR